MERTAQILARKATSVWHDLHGKRPTKNGEKNHGAFEISCLLENLNFLCVFWL